MNVLSQYFCESHEFYTNLNIFSLICINIVFFTYFSFFNDKITNDMRSEQNNLFINLKKLTIMVSFLV